LEACWLPGPPGFYPADWTTIPPDSTASTGQKTAAVENICRAATATVNGYVGFPLHAVVNTEYMQGPNYRVTVQNSTGNGRIILQRWPITQILSVSVSPNNTFPRQYTALPAGSWDIEVPVLGGNPQSYTPSGSGEGGQAILIAPGWCNWALGRWGWRIQIQYIHGWPHTSLTAAASAGATSLTVEDITAFGPPTSTSPGAAATIYDITDGQEAINVTAATPTSGTVPTGPGTLTLKNPLTYAHAAGIIVSGLPSNIIWATTLYAAADALTRGATATALRAAPGTSVAGGGAEELRLQAELTLAPYRATV
jgi:hypothetical protein